MTKFDKFDIQLFAEEENTQGDVTFENPESENAPEPIPEELSDISEDVAREVMEQHKAENPTPKVEDSAEEEDFKNVKISYSQHKKVLDEKSETEKLLEEYKKRFGDLNSPPPQNYSQPAMQQNFQQQVPPPNEIPEKPPEPKYFGADDVKQINDAIKQYAMQMTGFTQDTIDELDYLDDDDPRLEIWQGARRFAENAVYNQIAMAQIQSQQEQIRRNAMFDQSVTDFNSYVSQQKAAEDFERLQSFATNEFFNSQSPAEQQILLEANTRLEHQQAIPTDFIIVRDFFTRAKAAFDAKNRQVQKPVSSQRKQNPQFPRTDKVNGATGSGGAISAVELANMVKNTDWNKVPPQYKDYLLNATT